MLGLVSLPILAAVLFRVAETTTTPREFADDITASLVASAILPLVMLLLGVAIVRQRGLGPDARLPHDEAARPLADRRAEARGDARSSAACPSRSAEPLRSWSSSRETWAAHSRPRGGLLVGAAAYAAIFTWAGLALRHALVVGLVYVFVWEAALAAYLDGIRFLSVRRFALSLVNGLDAERLADAELAASAATIGVVLVLAGFTALAIRKLRRMDVP